MRGNERELDWDDYPMGLALAAGRTFICGYQALYERREDSVIPVYEMSDVGVGVTSSPNQEFLFVRDGVRVIVIDIDTGAILANWRASGESANDIVMSPDGRIVIVVGCDEGGTMKRFEMGKSRASKTWGSIRYGQVAWTSDDEFVTLSRYGSSYLSRFDRDLTEEETLGSLEYDSMAIAFWNGDLIVGGPDGVHRIESRSPLETDLLWSGPEVTFLMPRDEGTLLVGTMAGAFLLSPDLSADEIGDGEIIWLASDGQRVGWIRRGEEDVFFVANL